MKILHIVGARPNFMKVAPLLRAFGEHPGVETLLVHTGQHYDEEMSGAFFRELDLPRPDMDLGVGSGSHATQTAAVMTRLEPVLLEQEPDMVVVVGDVNSTVAAALTAAKLHIAVAHVEAGLRSGDRRMPEELNRLVTDQLSDLCLTPSRDADENLRAEGIGGERVVFIGNVMIDSLMHALPAARELDAPGRRGLVPGEYGLVTLHRPGNVDDPEVLGEILAGLEQVSGGLPLVFPVHPRTRQRLGEHGWTPPSEIRLEEPVGYLEMLSLMAASRVALTDSGGLQEETTALGVPCLTLRANTERPITVTEGTNTLVPERTAAAIVAAVEGVPAPGDGPARRPEGWDGNAAGRAVSAILGGEWKRL